MQNASETREPPMLRELFLRLVQDEFRKAFEARVEDLAGLGRIARLTQIADVGTHGVTEFQRVMPARDVTPSASEAKRLGEMLAQDAIRFIETAEGRVEMADAPSVAVLDGAVRWSAVVRIQSLTAPV